MKKFVNITLILTMITIIAGIIVSCAELSECSLVRRATLNGGFFSVNASNRPVAGALNTLSVSVRINTTQADTILNQDQNVKYISLPLQYAVDSTAIIFHYHDGYNTTDTIVFKHTNKEYFVSPDCGFDMLQAVTDFYYTTHGLDSILLTDKNTHKDGKENLRIFFPAASE